MKIKQAVIVMGAPGIHTVCTHPIDDVKEQDRDSKMKSAAQPNKIKKDNRCATLSRKQMESNLKERIKEKAKALFLTYGLKSVSMDDIAQRSGISKKTIYQSFEDKDALVYAIVNALVRSHKDVFKAARETAIDAIDEVIKQDTGSSLVCRDVRPSFMYDLEKYFPEAWDMLEQYKSAIHEDIVANLRRGIQEKLYREDINITVMSALRMEQLLNFLRPKTFINHKAGTAQLMAEFSVVYLHSISTEKGRQLLYQYTN
jgi:AcrR family transcriptional regulator